MTSRAKCVGGMLRRDSVVLLLFHTTVQCIIFLAMSWIAKSSAFQQPLAFLPKTDCFRSLHLKRLTPATFFVKQTTWYTCRISFSSLKASKVSQSKTKKKTATKKQQQVNVPKKKSGRPFHLMIVESPNKCQSLQKILDEYVSENNLPYDYHVTSCMGHVRNLRTTGTASIVGKRRFPYTIHGIDLEGGRYTPQYVVPADKKSVVLELQALTKEADEVVLATDPDREGEAMAWHLQELLTSNTNDASSFRRVSFTEITPSAIREAVSGGTDKAGRINPHLVQAQETRRVLDRLAGYTVSPILWRKISPGLSAGRVQSVGLALLVQRERERLSFEPIDYASVTGTFVSNDDTTWSFPASLRLLNGESIAMSGSDFTPQGQQLTSSSSHKVHLRDRNASDLVKLLQSDTSCEWKVISITSKKRHSHPSPPYRTSTLQQDSVSRLGLSVQQTMIAAQKLYEQGYISYMRTDSTQLSDDAEAAVAVQLQSFYGVTPSSQGATANRNTSRFSQEAHEAIRPAIQDGGRFASPDDLQGGLTDAAKSVYRLIFQRTLASRMPPLVTNQTQVKIEGVIQKGHEVVTMQFWANGRVVLSPGFTMAYSLVRNDDGKNENHPDFPLGNTLPSSLEEGQVLIGSNKWECLSHQTNPPPRYTEASFVKELEALGVGRPSTYASTVQLLRDRAYVGSPPSSSTTSSNVLGQYQRNALSGGAISALRAAGGEKFTGRGDARAPMVPSLSAFAVCSLLEKSCPSFIDPEFTARMEERLDQIANGATRSGVEAEVFDDERVAYLNEFYAGQNGLAAQIKCIEDAVPSEEARRVCLPALPLTSNVALMVGPWGPYIQRLEAKTSCDEANEPKPETVSLPRGLAFNLSSLTVSTMEALLEAKRSEANSVLGDHPDDGRPVIFKLGRFGAYLQWGSDNDENKSTHSLPKHMAQSFENGLSLKEAVAYTGLPRTVCMYNDLPITASIGPYGPYLKYNSSYLSLSDETHEDLLSIDTTTATRMILDGIVNSKKGDRKPKNVVAELGEKEGALVSVKSGRFGQYLNWKKVNARLPIEYCNSLPGISLDEAWVLIQERVCASLPAKGRAKKSQLSSGNSSSPSDLPPQPKRPMSAYLHFCSQKRPEVTKQAKSFGETSKALAQLWADTSEADKKEFIQKAKAGKEIYLQQKQKWEAECQAMLKRPKKERSSSRKSSTQGPKKPRSAYLYFCSANRPSVSQQFQGLSEITKELARQWSELGDRSEYEAMASKDKERFAREMEEEVST